MNPMTRTRSIQIRVIFVGPARERATLRPGKRRRDQLTEHKTFHNDGNNAVVWERAADVDVVELSQEHLVDADDHPRHSKFTLEEGPDDPGDIGVDNQQERLALPDLRKRGDDPIAEFAEGRVVRAVVPVHGQRKTDVGGLLPIGEIESVHPVPHCSSDR